MNDFLLDNDGIYSDKFKVSLNTLFFDASRVFTRNSLIDMLDKNGYFGRHRVELFSGKNSMANSLLKVHVYLPDSCIEYTWPFNTHFDLANKKFGHNRKIPRGVFSNKFMFNYCMQAMATAFIPDNRLPKTKGYFEIKAKTVKQHLDLCNDLSRWPSLFAEHHGGYGQRPFYERIVPFLARCGFIRNNKFVILGGDDANEVASNLFDIDYWQNF